ncbi:antitoxin VbhA family protein [Bartonella quintana]|uniref:Uncharacterized protein n=2 Tax=Bartonella quintana TaxID=803 RepID=W3TV04_BARQI|nr:antitoxin VbhA family protein [Bartonella quintana]ETS11882.1 hypothetical protein Q651_00935 [Bartonella quintana BQ2-D70]ETS13057.1 hypothetical protein Q650_01348 [Bartonella quintana JK 73rel]ETS15131.1 hypothetical protein Q649_01350 [Bartonella quintana JK 73]ETS16601.1 hypothetical protein Q648_01331 [Bartonella quintana JK 12]ETS17392.1 hypothetical protein Q647_01345 [Bartonella quintana JK 7]
MKTTRTGHFTTFMLEELQKHRETIDKAISIHALEGRTLRFKMLEISKEYAKGDFSPEEFNHLINHPPY